MRSFPAVVERCPETGLFVGWVPGFPEAHSQGETLDELHRNLREVLELLLEDGDGAREVGPGLVHLWLLWLLRHVCPSSRGRTPASTNRIRIV